jgi:hypothetical protein
VCAASQLHGFATGLLSALPERQNADLVQQIDGGAVSREISIAVRKKQCYDRKKCENTEYRVRKEGTEEKFERAVVQLARPRWKVREKASTIHPESGCIKMLKFISTPSAGCSFPSSPAPPASHEIDMRCGSTAARPPAPWNPELKNRLPVLGRTHAFIQLSEGPIDHIICSALSPSTTSLVSLGAGCTADTTLQITYINMLSIDTWNMSSVQHYVDVGRSSSRETLLFCSNSTKVSSREISISISIPNVLHWSWPSSIWQIQLATANMP